MTDAEQRAAAKKFAAYWQGKGYEKGQSQPFWLSLLRNVYGVEHPETYIEFEDKVMLDHTSFIDGMIPATHVLIEQKELGKDLRKAIRQSDGSLLSPYQQALRYSANLPYSKRPRYIVTCNFSSFLVYDMEHPQAEPEEILLANLSKEYYRLNFLTDTGDAHLKKELEVSVQAGDLVGRLYDALLKKYIDPESEATLKSLNVLCVRLVFCLYAEDAGIFGGRAMFHDYLAGFRQQNMRKALIDLFKMLDTKEEDRDPYENADLLAFPYVNGGLFADESIVIPQLDEEICDLLMEDCSERFDWSEISPTIFGAVFESTLNPETRRHGGMHYTSIENIHKVIDPLFLTDLRSELDRILAEPARRTREAHLRAYQEKLARLTFLDPACGSGNFLTETYLSLRRLENRVIDALTGGQMVLGALENPIRVSISQFYGIEINDFAVTVAKTALWIAESQMMKETEAIVHMDLDFLPLKTNAFIHEGNALKMDWKEIVTGGVYYIMGNPPFVGARLMSKEQKADVMNVFSGWKNVGNLDYVSCWYKKTADLVKGTTVRAALVSTNSVTQGDSVATLWKPLFADGVHIDFAYRTFRWDSESNQKAHVHCVIVGFSTAPNEAPRRIFEGARSHEVSHINAYLIDAADVFVESRSKPLCNVPQIGMGNQPIDDGNYLFSKEEMEEFLRKEPKAEKYFRPWYGSREFINRCPRYCLWLGDASPGELRKMPECMKRIEAVRNFRLSSKRAGTVKSADKPTHFQTENMPHGMYMVIPKVSSEKRRYIPMGVMNENALSSDLLFVLPDVTLYHFGVLNSNVHNAWTRVVCGRLKSDYRYSKDIVYNNFPWPEPSDAQRAAIEKTSQAILAARARYPDASLADLYDELTMPPDLRRAHQENDKAVMTAYGWNWRGMTESDCVAELMKRYQQLAAEADK